jgi:hypothetical protein
MKSLSFGPPQQNPYGQHWFRDDADEEGMDVSESQFPNGSRSSSFADDDSTGSAI